MSLCMGASPRYRVSRTVLGLAWLALLIGLHAAKAFGAAQARVALVIGNAEYAQRPLKNPVNDARDLARALESLGFEVMLRINRSDVQMKEDLAEFQDRMEKGRGVGLFYFSGHGMQAGRRSRNFLLPVGRRYQRERDVELFGIDARAVLARMEAAGNALNIVILDACRDSPLPAAGRSGASRGLGRMQAPSGSLIAFSTAPGKVADDNTAGRNGLYTKHLLAAVRTPGLRLEDVFKQVGREVERESNHAQSPEEISKLRNAEPFYFNRSGPQLATIEVEPGGGGVDFGDLERLRREREAVRASLSAWQARMEADFARAEAFSDAKLSVEAWSRFLSGYKEDNPYSGEDERLRREAVARRARAQARLAGAGNESLGGAMVRIEPGCFQMGSPPSEDGRYDNERRHRVCIERAFAIGKYEVTQRQWEALMGRNPSRFKCANCPVEQVSWNDVMTFIEKLNARSGVRYRLPTEAEWEYACRGGRSGETYCGGDDLGAVGWYDENSGGRTHPVGQKRANGFGLHDMSGNVWEWTCSGYDKDYSGGEQGCADAAAQYVSRGGGWDDNPRDARSAFRDWITPDIRNLSQWFRLARTLP